MPSVVQLRDEPLRRSRSDHRAQNQQPPAQSDRSSLLGREEYIAAAPADDPELPRLQEEMKELEKQRGEFVLNAPRTRRAQSDRSHRPLRAGRGLMEPTFPGGHWPLAARPQQSKRTTQGNGQTRPVLCRRNMLDLAARPSSMPFPSCSPWIRQERDPL